MSKTKHTPPPCKITGESGDNKRIFIEGAPDEWERLEIHVVSDDCDYETAKANAEFIVRAYNGYEALRETCEELLKKWWEEAGRCLSADCLVCKRNAQDKARFEAILAQAEKKE